MMELSGQELVRSRDAVTACGVQFVLANDWLPTKNYKLKTEATKGSA